ncbi:MAG: HNH endonuclease [Candidatus Sumerlaeota bacterium]|nr:HNH endonuclease [Candidatus Sumerlaeota bacterium]
MRPVKKRTPAEPHSAPADIKRALISQLGEFCCYCERHAAPQDLDVEHIYPQVAHPRLKNKWRNFLLACSSCNTNKRHHLGNGRQAELLKRFFWPHIDNTATAFEYRYDGYILPSSVLPAGLKQMAKDTINLAGLCNITKQGMKYDELGIAYDAVRCRRNTWQEALSALHTLAQNPTDAQRRSIIAQALTKGYFSVWMRVFENDLEFRNLLIQSFPGTAADCFDRNTTAPISPRSGGKI